METSSSAAAERAAREAYGRLVAILTSRTGDVAAAEDALSDAFVAALERWPSAGVPARPEGWLLEVARRRDVDRVRRAAVRDRGRDALEDLARSATDDAPGVPDRRLQLLFMCAHPSIDPAIRAPLMLQVVLGLDAHRIGRAFLVAPTTMGQRLSRAKRKIRDAKIPFELPDDRMAERRGVVCEAIYAAFATSWDETAADRRTGLAHEAIWLGRLMVAATERDPEAAGLLALMLHVEARRPARRDADGGFVPLDRQDPSRWDRALVTEAEQWLWAAAERETVGRFQLEAAIQSAHAHRRLTGRTDWTAIEALYRRLLEHADTLGARVAHLAAMAEAVGPDDAYRRALTLEGPATQHHQPYWTLRAHLERRMGQDPSASVERAMALTEDEGVRAYLRRI